MSTPAASGSDHTRCRFKWKKLSLGHKREILRLLVRITIFSVPAGQAPQYFDPRQHSTGRAAPRGPGTAMTPSRSPRSRPSGAARPLLAPATHRRQGLW
jgi:hypothetical protein